MSNKRIISKGFESAFINSWTGWDEQDFLCLQFYDVEFTNEFSKEVGVDGCEFVCINLENMYIEGYSDDEVIFFKNLKLSIK